MDGKQLIMELWAYNIDFKAFEVRFKYDDKKLQPSIISTAQENATNTPVNDILNVNKYFEFVGEFSSAMEIDPDLNETGNAGNVITAYAALLPPKMISTSEHIIEKEDGKKVITAPAEGIQIGKMSFRMLKEDAFDIESFGFELVPGSSGFAPITGIKIIIDDDYHYIDQRTFRFTDATASKDANLLDIVVSSGEKNDDPEQNTYKKYDLDPEFNNDLEEQKYTVTLLDYLDTIDITATLSDNNATMKIRKPKHDEDGNLVYEGEGTTNIEYEEEDLTNKVPYGVTLNKLGEPDTIITIIVKADDGVTTREYEVTIKRPFGIIKGTIYTISTESTTNIHKSDIRLYKSSDVATIINWEDVVAGSGDDIHDQLLTLTSQNYKTNDDGTYEIYVIPGTYDILLDKPGYLDHIYASRTVTDGATVDLGYKALVAGDFNKDGAIQGKDLALLMGVYGANDVDAIFDEQYDLNEDKAIQGKDLALFFTNYYELRKID